MDALQLAFAGVARQAQLLRDREISSRELVELYLSRIERLDPQLNAFRTVYAERALAGADAADRRLGAGEHAPLLGVPIAVKDDTDVEGDVTSHGSRAHGPPAVADSEVVRRLRAAGAIPLGHTNVPELEIFPFTESEAWGQTRNPWDTSRVPGGSSGGSAAAVAAGLVGAATGSDGMGSIRTPSACCGVFGVKTQRGRISVAPKRESWHGLSVLGPIARRVGDAALLLDVMAGPAAGDPPGPPPPERPYAQAAATPPGRLRVGVSRQVPPPVVTRIHPRIVAAIDGLAATLRGLGHQVDDCRVPYGTALPHAVTRYLRGIHDAGAAMAHPERLEARTRSIVRLGRLVPRRLLAAERAREPALRSRVWQAFDGHDVLLTPIHTAPVLETARFRGRGAVRSLDLSARWVGATCGVWNVLGNPSVAVPAGLDDDGVPVGVQIVGRAGDEATLISLAAQLEAELGWPDRRPALAAS